MFKKEQHNSVNFDRIKNEQSSNPRQLENDQYTLGAKTPKNTLEKDKNQVSTTCPPEAPTSSPIISDKDGWIDFEKQKPEIGQRIQCKDWEEPFGINNDADAESDSMGFIYGEDKDVRIFDKNKVFGRHGYKKWKPAKPINDGWIYFDKQKPEIGQRIITKIYKSNFNIPIIPKDTGKIIQPFIWSEEDKENIWVGQWKPADHIEITTVGTDNYCDHAYKELPGKCIKCTEGIFYSPTKEYCQCDEPLGKAMRCSTHLDQYCGHGDECKMERYCAYCENAIHPHKLIISDPKVDNKSDLGCQSQCTHYWQVTTDFKDKKDGTPIELIRTYYKCKYCECEKPLGTPAEQQKQMQSECKHDWDHLMILFSLPPQHKVKCKLCKYETILSEEEYNRTNQPKQADDFKNSDAQDCPRCDQKCFYENRDFPLIPGVSEQRGYCLTHNFWYPCPNDKFKCTCIDKIIEAIDYLVETLLFKIDEAEPTKLFARALSNKLKELKDK